MKRFRQYQLIFEDINGNFIKSKFIEATDRKNAKRISNEYLAEDKDNTHKILIKECNTQSQ